MILPQIYEKNVERLAKCIAVLMTRQLPKFDMEAKENQQSYFSEDLQPKIYINWSSSLSLNEIPAIVVNLERISFIEITDKTTNEQKVKTAYGINFISGGKSDAESIKKILIGLRLVRQALITSPLDYFEALELSLDDFEISRTNEVAADNIYTAQMNVEITTVETLTGTDINTGGDYATSNFTRIDVLPQERRNIGGDYATFIDWGKKWKI